MLKPLNIKYKGREVSLECTHKKTFPPPQMYGSTPDDIDNLWKQGTIDQSQYQHLKTWQAKCGLMVMGPKCLDCPLALKRNPRPGRPNVIETKNWLEEKRKMHWDDMKSQKEDGPTSEEMEMLSSLPEPRDHEKNFFNAKKAKTSVEEGEVEVVEERVEEPGPIPWTDKEPVGFKNVELPGEEPAEETSEEAVDDAEEEDSSDISSLFSKEEEDEGEDDIINALAED